MVKKRSEKKKEAWNFKKLTKKQQLKLTAIAGIAAVLIVVLVLVFHMNSSKAEASSGYKTVTIKNADALVFNGNVSPEHTEEFFNDQTKGTLTSVLVTNGQEVPANTALLAYQNDTMQEQVDEQQQQIGKLNLAVTTAQQNLTAAYNKKQDLENEKSTAASSVPAAAAGMGDSAASSFDEAISQQDEVIMQAQQALDAANMDLSTANQGLESARGKVTTNVSSTFDGVAMVDENGKGDATVPVVKIVSKTTLVDAKVSEYDYKRVAKDQAVTIQPTSSDKKIQGTIIEVNELPDDSAAAAAASGTGGASQGAAMASYTFKVKPSEDMQYGYSCQVSIPVNELRLPEKAIVKDHRKQYVFVYAKGKVKKTLIKAEEKDGLFIVTKGLKEKEKVISNPDKALKDGQEVTVS